jgi:hypothetical protein
MNLVAMSDLFINGPMAAAASAEEVHNTSIAS